MNNLTTTTTDAALVTTDDLRLDRNPAAVYIASLTSELSRATMRGALDTVARMVGGDQADALSFPWQAMRYEHTAAIRARLAERYAPASANKMLAALRGAMRAAWRLGLMTAEDYHRAADVTAVKGDRLPAGRSITTGELAALMDVCAADLTAAGARDAAILALMYTTGCRRAEVCAADLADYDPAAGLVVRGKGRKERLVHVVNGAADAMADWLAIRGDRPGALFLPVRKGGHVVRVARLSTTAINMLLQRRAKAAGVKAISCHDFRRSFIGDHLDAGTDLALVARMAGHASVTTTASYDRRPEAAKRAAAEALHIPYRRRVIG